jgi:hypothetical protein
MKIFGYIVIKEKDLEKKLKDEYKRGVNDGVKSARTGNSSRKSGTVNLGKNKLHLT